jgi:hypothetical protein
MTLFGINVIATLRQRIGAVLGAFGASAACCLCGAVTAFVLAPGQAVRAFNVSRLPQMDAAAVEAAAPGDTILITGVLSGNTPQLPNSSLVVYEVEEWKVTVTEGGEDSEESRTGRWQKIEIFAPELALDMNGQTVQVRVAELFTLSGSLHEELAPSDSAIVATYEGQPLGDGSRRYKGLVDGDLTTVLGQKAAAGGVLPQHIFGGDRVAFEASQQQAASGLLFSGICAMALSPVVLALGLLGAIFYRRR